MPVRMDELIDVIESIAPPYLAYEWDNTGIQLKCAEEVNRALISLDITSETINQAKAKDCDMIVSHHPLFFESFKSLNCGNVSHAIAMQLIKSGISVYSAHTSYDRAAGGIGDILASMLGLVSICADPIGGEGVMRTGCLKESMNKSVLLEHIKNALKVKTLRISNTNIDIIKKVAVVGGSGGGFSKAVKESGAQALLTGEAKHHHFIEAAANGVLLIEAGHFQTEQYFVHEVFMSLQSRVNELQLEIEIYKADNVQAPYEFV